MPTTPSTQPFFEYRHPRVPREAFFALSADDVTVTLECRWPLDIDTNEWVDVSFALDRSAVRSALRATVETGEGEARDERGQGVRFQRVEEGQMHVEIWEGSGRVSTDLTLPVSVSGEQLRSMIRTLA